MEYKRLGISGLRVSRLGLGTMMLGERTDEAESIKIVHRAIDAGINLIDTADVYGAKVGDTEAVVGKALKGKRDQVVLATKVYNAMGESPNDRGSSRYHIMQAVEASLGRLSTDHIDLYQLHRHDAQTPMEETLRALDDLVRQGKVRYIGCSNFPAWAMCKALWVSDVNNLERIVSDQPRYNLLYRSLEAEIAPFCLEHGIGIIAFSTLARGLLSGKYSKGAPLPPDSRANLSPRLAADLTDRNFAIIERLRKMAEARGVTIGQFAISWVLANPAVSSALVGPRTVEQLEDNLGTAGLELTKEELDEVDKLSPPPAGG
jgi:aryl-alcohol dehydrogenase-like predicted oxidoreductase